MELGGFKIGKDMFLEGAEVIKILEVRVNFIKVNFEIIMNKDIAQAGHWEYALGKIPGDDVIRGDDFDCLFIIASPCPVIVGDYIMADIKERLYAYL